MESVLSLVPPVMDFHHAGSATLVQPCSSCRSSTLKGGKKKKKRWHEGKERVGIEFECFTYWPTNRNNSTFCWNPAASPRDMSLYACVYIHQILLHLYLFIFALFIGSIRTNGDNVLELHSCEPTTQDKLLTGRLEIDDFAPWQFCSIRFLLSNPNKVYSDKRKLGYSCFHAFVLKPSQEKKRSVGQ